MKKESRGNDFPRFSTSGTLILSVNLVVSFGLFHSSSYGHALLGSGNNNLATSKDTTFSTNIWVFLTSLLNVLSHSAVVLGALHDTFVISILIGVGFDVLTRVLQLYWWMELMTMVQIDDHPSSTILSHHETKVQLSSLPSSSSSLMMMDTFFLGFLSLLFLYQVYIHIRALLLVHNDSLERMQTVLQGALNNLRGIAGDSWKDHLFAYSDLSLHLLPCWLSAVMLRQQAQLHSIFPFLALTAGIMSLIPLQTGNYKKNSKVELTTKKHHDGLPLGLLKIVHSTGDPRMRICCTCGACSHRTKRTGKKTTFVCNPLDGLCSLWMLSFEEASAVLDHALRRSNISVDHKQT